MARNILHCDMNNFYASVECMLNPALKEYPVAVCGSVEERHGIVLAKNYKAKAFDVKTGDTVWQAQQKCRDLVIVPPHYEEYIKYSKLARSVYERYTDQVEPYGMDECWLDITGTGSLFGSPVEVANKIRETIKFELGLTISVGVSFNKIFAKLGSDMKKPDAVTVIPKDRGLRRMARNILHCDMNNFYASVECMLNPALKEYPVAVCGSVEERHGIVLAKNYKAKAFDVKTGDTVWQAQQKCRDLVIVPPHYEEYIKYSKLARSVYERYTDQVEPYGMDECWLDITGTGSLFGSPVEVANKIRETIKFELGLTISVGVSFNKIFAKLGSDMKKPDAVTVIPKDTFREKIWKLPSADLLGVGRATQRTLDSYGIRTIGALAQTDPEFLRSVLGKNGVALWNYANGNDLSLVAKKDFVSPIKSVGHGITTVADLEKPEQVWPVFLELTQDIGHKLRVHGLSAEGVAIHIRDNTLCTRQWQTKIDLPTQSPMVLAKRAFQLFEARYGWYNPIRSVTIQAINLIPQDTPRQIGLFMDVEKQEKLERLEKCIETIRRRFGKDSIRNGVLYQDLQLPPEKVEITMPTGMVG